MRETLPLNPWSPQDHPRQELHWPNPGRKLLPTPAAADPWPHQDTGDSVLTLCQVQDGPCHSEPPVPADHLQPIQQAHDKGFLLSPVQLQPPPARHCKGTRAQPGPSRVPAPAPGPGC